MSKNSPDFWKTRGYKLYETEPARAKPVGPSYTQADVATVRKRYAKPEPRGRYSKSPEQIRQAASSAQASPWVRIPGRRWIKVQRGLCMFTYDRHQRLWTYRVISVGDTHVECLITNERGRNQHDHIAWARLREALQRGIMRALGYGSFIFDAGAKFEMLNVNTVKEFVIAATPHGGRITYRTPAMKNRSRTYRSFLDWFEKVCVPCGGWASEPTEKERQLLEET